MSGAAGPSPDLYEGEEHAAGMERWLLTYSDMITLLLVLFIVLYALSSLNHVKYAEFEHGVSKSFAQGNTAPVPAAAGKSPSKLPSPGKPLASLQTINADLLQALRSAGLAKDVSVDLTSQGLVEGFLSGKLFFGNDEAALTPLGKRVVAISAHVIARYANGVNVDGYANSIPVVGGPYANNWVLSSVRADNVVTELSADGDSPNQLIAIGFGSYHPLVTGNTATSLAANRRVNIVVLPGRVQTP